MNFILNSHKRGLNMSSGQVIIRDPGSFCALTPTSSILQFSPPTMAVQTLAIISGMRRRRTSALPLNTCLPSHTLLLCSHPIDLNLVTHPYLPARKDLGKVDCISAKNSGRFHWRRNGEQILRRQLELLLHRYKLK